MVVKHENGILTKSLSFLVVISNSNNINDNGDNNNNDASYIKNQCC